MNKQELLVVIAEKTGLTKVNINIMLKTIIETITEALAKNEEVKLIGFGNFSVFKSKERSAKNPRTGMKFMVAATNRIRFKVGQDLKTAVTKEENKLDKKTDRKKK